MHQDPGIDYADYLCLIAPKPCLVNEPPRMKRPPLAAMAARMVLTLFLCLAGAAVMAHGAAARAAEAGPYAMRALGDGVPGHQRRGGQPNKLRMIPQGSSPNRIRQGNMIVPQLELVWENSAGTDDK